MPDPFVAPFLAQGGQLGLGSSGNMTGALNTNVTGLRLQS